MTRIERKSLSETLIAFERSRYKEVPGVAIFKGRAPGPVACLSACTHGNEPSGLAALAHIRRIVEQQGLRRGTLLLIVNNLRAARAYLLNDRGIRCKHPRKRYVDHNMNRLPHGLGDLAGDLPYEVVRARQLLPIWRRIKFGLDFHSTSQDSPPMIITGWNRFPAALVRGMRIRRVLSNIDIVQIGKPAFAFYGTGQSSERVFEIESGGHEVPATFARAKMCAELFLRNLRMIQGRVRREAFQFDEYHVYGHVRLQTGDYRLRRVFRDFERVPKGAVLASGPGPDYVAPRVSHTLFCPADLSTVDTSEEALYLTERVRRHRE